MGPEAGFFDTRTGKITAIVGILAAVTVVVYSVWGFSRRSDAEQLSRQRMFICSVTGKAFEYDLQPGVRFPVLSPFSGKETGYPAEACYWTKDGKVKGEPTWVLLNEAIHKPGPTFCPDCGRLVIGHNPFPSTGDQPPPTQSEINDQRGGNPR